MNSILGWVKRYPLASFFVLTFALCWGIGAPLKGTPIISQDGSFVGGILVAALLIAGITQGRAGLLDLGSRLVRWRVPLQWYAVVVALPLVIVGGAVALISVLGGTPLDWSERPELAPMAGLLVLLIVLPLGAPFAEEVGWRGFALPRLLATRPPLIASLILGMIWSLWHIPVLISDPELRVPVPFLLSILPLSVLFTWIFIHTNGSVLIAILFHAWYDVTLAFVTDVISTDDYALMWWLLFAIQSAIAAGVVVFTRDRALNMLSMMSDLPPQLLARQA